MPRGLRRTPTCFMCDQPGVNRDHVPPLSFFPSLEVAGADYRKNLITVPACVEHNNYQSKNDEYALAVLFGHYQNNHVSEFIQGSIDRAIQHRPALQKTFYPSITLTERHGVPVEVFELDMERLSNALRKMALGLYFHELKDRWKGDVLILPFNAEMLFDHEVQEDLTRTLQIMYRLQSIWFEMATRMGENQGVFYYQLVAPPEERAHLFMKMVFWKGVEVIAIFTHN